MMHLLLMVVAFTGLSNTTSPEPVATAQTTVVAVPFAGPPGLEWIGEALAHAINLRVFAQPDLNGLSLRQIRAAARNEGGRFEAVKSAAQARTLRRQLGADVLLVGHYSVEDKTIRVNATLLGGTKDEEREAKLTLQATTTAQLVGLEAELATALARSLGAEKPNVNEAAFGTGSVDAWREVVQGMNTLSYQSLSPQRARDPADVALTPVQLTSAAENFDRATQLDPTYGEAWAGRGMSAVLAGDYDAARTYLQRCTALLGEHQPTAVFATYVMRLRNGQPDQAATVLQRAIDRHPGFLQARAYLGELRLMQKRYADALNVYTEALALAPKQPWILAQRGYAKTKLGDHTGAITDTLAANELLPDSPALLVQLASRYIDAGKLVGAEDSLLRAQELEPTNGRTYVRLCYVHLLRRNNEQAISLCETGLRLSKGPEHQRDRAYVHLNLAQLLGRAGKLDEALDHLKRAKTLGVNRFAALQTDPGLANLRADPRYDTLVN